MKPNKFNIKNKKDRAEFIDNFWLNLNEVHNIKTGNVIGKHKLFNDNPPLAIVDLMSRPENFGWTCKVIFDFQAHPMQTAILKMLWNHPFSILTATRGGSKTTLLAIYAMLRALFIPNSKILFIGNAFRQSKLIFSHCENMYRRSPMFQDILGLPSSRIISHNVDMFVFHVEDSTITSIPLGNGDKIRGQRSTCLHPNSIIETEIGLMRISDYQQHIQNDNPKLFTGSDILSLEAPSHFMTTNKIDAYRIKMMGGYDFVCSENHQVLTTNGWKLGKDLSKKDLLVFKNEYTFPQKNIELDGVELDEDLAWLFGMLVSEGYIANKSNMIIRMIDEDCINRIESCWKRLSDRYNWDLQIKRYVNKARTDKRGWINKESFNINICNYKLRDIFEKFGLDRSKARQKRMPWAILRSPKNVLLKFLSGLLEGDGTCFHWKDKMSDKNLGIAYYSGSRQLNDEVHIVLSKLGIFASKGSRASKLSVETQFFIRLYGPNAIKFYNMVDVPKWDFFKDNYYIGPGIKKKPRTELIVKEVIKLDDKISMCDLSLPETHSFYGNLFIQHNCTICDEFNSLNEEIYQEVIQGFSSVSLNPIQQVRELAQYQALLELDEIDSKKFEEIQALKISNQQIISGTCGYKFEPLYKMWKKYHDAILSRGNEIKIKQIFNDEIPIGFSPKDYAIARLPYTVYPKGYIDEKSIGRAKATTHAGIFGSEYETLFLTDSQGFFKRTLIENATCGRALTKLSKKCGDIDFTIMMEGNPTGKYVMGVDPASQADNFAIVILEIWEDHRRIVHSWTTNNNAHKLRLKYGLIKEHDYYRHCARKIRLFMKLFNIAEISIDAQGGGRAIAEILGDPSHLESGEHPLYPVVDIAKPLATDYLEGLHILHLIEFSNAEWTYNANHNLKQDIETRELLFPACSSADFGLLHDMDVLTNRIQDEAQEIGDLRETAEDVLLEIEELKNELVLIEHTKTASGRDRWDTPQIKGLNSKKGRLRKDRYSALLMANAIGRMSIARTIEYEYDIMGGFAKNLVSTADRIKAKEVPDVSAGFSFGVGVKRR